MKIILKIIGFLFALVILIGVGAVFMVPKDRIIEEVKIAFKQETGRDLQFSEDVGLSFYPNVGVVLKDVTLSNAEWSDEPVMARIGSADVLLALMPLLEREVIVKRFVLKEPNILLQVNQDNVGNWEFANSSEVADQPQQATDDQKAPEFSNSQLKLSEIEIVDGRLRYVNATKSVDEEITDVDLVVNAPNLNGRGDIDGSMIYKGETLNLSASLDNLGALTAGDATPASIEVKTEAADLSFEGEYNPKDEYLMHGALDVDVRSLSRLLKLTGFEGRQGVMPYNAFTMKMQGKAGLDDFDYSAFNFQAGDLTISGKGRVILSGAKPFFGGTYNINALDVNKFLAAPKKAQGKTVDAEKNSDQKANKIADSGSGWDTKPIDYSFLKAVNLNIIANVGKYLYDGLEFGANTMQIEIKDRVLEMNMSDTPAFGGMINQTTVLNANKDIPTIRINSKIKNMKSREVFKYFADYEKLSGDMNATLFNVTANAKSMSSIANTLTGTVDVLFQDGEITGISFVDWAKKFQNRLANVDTNYGSTKFVAMKSQFNIANGMARGNVITLEGPLVNATARGDLNIAQKTLDYTIDVTLVPNAQSDTSVRAGVNMPFKATGTWSNPKIRPNISGLVENILKDPKAAEQELKNLKEVGKTLEDSLKGEKGAVKKMIEDGGALKDLLKSF